MSHAITAEAGHAQPAMRPVDMYPALSPTNTMFAKGAGAKSKLVMGVGAITVAVAAIAGGMLSIGGVSLAHVLGAYHIAAMGTLALCLGAMFFVLVFHLLQAGWVGTIRRQFENVMGFVPFAFAMAAVTPVLDYFLGGYLFAWMSDEMASDYLLQKKQAFFFAPFHITEGHSAFPAFFFVRLAIYGFAWTFLSRRLAALSLEQDTSGNIENSAKARFMSAWGILVFALTTAFAGFDLLMSLDFRFFSTMWGVWYFAGAAFSGVALVTMVLAFIRRAGKLEGTVTSEHFHDLGKLMFSFTVFWAYISFSQYFLIWYSNIPEETAFMGHRNSGIWKPLFLLLIFGHFIAPFLILIFRPIKRNPAALIAIGAWAILIHFMDIAWMIRPVAYLRTELPEPGFAGAWLELLMISGVLMVFIGWLVGRITSTRLVAVNDPYMHEAIVHKNYV